VDTAVFDVATRKLLFRAPGVNEFKSSSTLVDVERDVRAAQQKGFELAMADMTVNLDKELSTFKERIKSDGSVRITRVGGTSGGGGAANAGFLMLITGLLMLSARRRRC
jgi:rhombotail lipoprotein